MKKSIVLVLSVLGIILLVGAFQLFNSPELASEPPELLLTHNGETLNQTSGVVCWGNCHEQSKDRAVELGSSQSMNFKVNELPREATVEFELEGRQPDRVGYMANNRSTADNSVRGYSISLDEGTQDFVLPSASQTDFSNLVFIAEWYDKDELQGAIEIAFSVDYR